MFQGSKDIGRRKGKERKGKEARPLGSLEATLQPVRAKARDAVVNRYKP
jgi:hypothetical protein